MDAKFVALLHGSLIHTPAEQRCKKQVTSDQACVHQRTILTHRNKYGILLVTVIGNMVRNNCGVKSPEGRGTVTIAVALRSTGSTSTTPTMHEPPQEATDGRMDGFDA